MPIINPQQLILSEADTTFLNLVSNRITAYGQIPYNIPRQLIIDLIIESARKFYRQYYRATSQVFYHMKHEEILDFTQNNPIEGYNNLRGWGLILPKYVQVVREIYITNPKNIINAEEITEISMGIIRTSPYGSSLAGINSYMYNVAAVAKMTELQAYKSILGRSVAFTYSSASNSLFINEKITQNIILHCMVNVHIQELYNDDEYQKYVIARCKQELKRILGGHTIELPGGATMSADEICANANEDVQAVEDMLKAGNGIGDIIMSR